MNPKFKTLVEKKLAYLNFATMERPDEVAIDALIESKDLFHNNELSLSDNKYFEWCWTQYDLFGPCAFNSVEIASMVGARPVIIAAYIHRYGSEWASKLLWNVRKTTKFNLIKIGRAYWSVEMLQFFSKSMKPKTPNQSYVHKWSKNPDVGDQLEAMQIMGLYSMCEAIIPIHLFDVPNYLEEGQTSKTMRPVIRYKGFDTSGEDQLIQAYGVDF